MPVLSDCLFYTPLFSCPQGSISNVKGSRKFWHLCFVMVLHLLEVTLISIFLIWLQCQLVEKCILIIPLGNYFSHVSFILPFVKSSKEGLGIWVAVCNLHVTCDDSAFSSILSAVPLCSNWLVRSVSLLCSFHHSCGQFKNGISFGMYGVTALGFQSCSLPINLTPQVQLDFEKKCKVCAMAQFPLLTWTCLLNWIMLAVGWKACRKHLIGRKSISASAAFSLGQGQRVAMERAEQPGAGERVRRESRTVRVPERSWGSWGTRGLRAWLRHLAVWGRAELKDICGEAQVLWEDKGVSRTQEEGKWLFWGRAVRMQGSKAWVWGVF